MNLEDVQMELIRARMALDRAANGDGVVVDIDKLVEQIDQLFFKSLTPIHMMNLYERSAPGKQSDNFITRQAYRNAAATAIQSLSELWSDADEWVD